MLFKKGVFKYDFLIQKLEILNKNIRVKSKIFVKCFVWQVNFNPVNTRKYSCHVIKCQNSVYKRQFLNFKKFN